VSELPKIPGVTIQHEVARGGMGVVYRGRQDYLDRDVAVKLLSKHLEGGVFADRFHREARLLASLNHANIATIHGLEVEAGVEFLILERVVGDTLDEKLGSG